VREPLLGKDDRLRTVVNRVIAEIFLDKIPMNVALREIVEFTTAELKAAGLHLEGGPYQDLVSTFMIGGMREGWIGPWERGAK
jgi:hypothetical protein